MKTRKLTALLLAAVMSTASLFAGCGSDAESDNQHERERTSTEADSTTEEPESDRFILVVDSVIMSGPFIKSISFTNLDGDPVNMPADLNDWFTNATASASFTGVISGFSDSGGFSDTELAEGQALAFTFRVRTAEYHMGVTVGSQFVTRYSDGRFFLFPDETEGMNPAEPEMSYSTP
jgi:hypothetical protein